jgi:ABC-2 type transport system permease protein
VAKSLVSLAALMIGGVATVPLLIAAAFLGDAWPWVALPAGLAYGAATYLLGLRVAAGMLDRRMPELLGAVTPKR